MFPWPLVTLIDRIAWPLGFRVYVTARSGAWGADRIHFIRKAPDAKRLPRLKARS